MVAFVYVLAHGDRHTVHACDGDLSLAMAKHEAEDSEAVLLWGEALPDLDTAEALIPLIEALDDDRYAALLAGEDEARSLLIDPSGPREH